MRKSMKTVWLCAVALLACAFAGCSSDDDGSLSGAAFAGQIREKVLLAGNGNEVAFPESADTPGLYAAVAANAESARQYCARLTRLKWDSKPRTITLPDGYGTIRVLEGGKEGVFLTLRYDVKTIPGFTLEIVTRGHWESGRYNTPDGTTACVNCGWLLPAKEEAQTVKCRLCGYTW